MKCNQEWIPCFQLLKLSMLMLGTYWFLTKDNKFNFFQGELLVTFVNNRAQKIPTTSDWVCVSLRVSLVLNIHLSLNQPIFSRNCNQHLRYQPY